MADNGVINGSGEVVDQPRDEGASMEPIMVDQTAAGETVGTSAVASGGSAGEPDQQQEIDDGEKGRAREGYPRATVLTGAVGSSVEPGGSVIVAEGPPMVGGSSGDSGSSGAVGNVPRPTGSPPRDPARGKGAVITEEEEPTEVPVEYREQDIAFRPAASAAASTRHVPVTKQDIAEHLPDDRLARLLEENPDVGEIVLKAKEE
ncbi:hypothetical protein RHMOL_Rhmol10G0118100 [Rhododendron molle]|uniref:Uncharacterized protein n=1 Tax=Rhododendron molle TaxID=49168 RepID=A0ACC0M189_RHOML|nr:hypothetical protein RHMOL_Rhmol10G0118100 [Rhododendron molle]